MPPLVPRPLPLLLPAAAALAGRWLLAGGLDGDQGAVAEGVLATPLLPLLLCKSTGKRTSFRLELEVLVSWFGLPWPNMHPHRQMAPPCSAS